MKRHRYRLGELNPCLERQGARIEHGHMATRRNAVVDQREHRADFFGLPYASGKHRLRADVPWLAVIHTHFARLGHPTNPKPQHAVNQPMTLYPNRAIAAAGEGRGLDHGSWWGGLGNLIRDKHTKRWRAYQPNHVAAGKGTRYARPRARYYATVPSTV